MIEPLDKAWGENSRSRAAASSTASGRPSRRRHTAMTAPAFWRQREDPFVSLARSTNKAMAGYSMSASAAASDPWMGRRAGASGYSRSAAIRSGVLLVVTTRSFGQFATSRATSGAADNDLLEVIQEQERLLVADEGNDTLPERRPSASFTSSVCASSGKEVRGVE